MSIYMHIDGVEGDVTAKNYEKWIELEHFAFKGWRNLNTAFGKTANREGSLPNFGEIAVKTHTSTSTPSLLTKFAASNAISQVKIAVTHNDSEPTPHLQITLSNVLISSFAISSHHPHHAGSEQLGAPRLPQKDLALNYTGIEVKTYPSDAQNKSTTALAAMVNLETGTVR